MKVQFIGPAQLGENKGVNYPALLNGHPLTCHFSYEVLEDVDPDTILGDPLEHFERHRLKLLSIAEQKIISGHAHAGKIQIYSSDLASD